MKEYFHYDDQEERVYIQRVQDVEPILKKIQEEKLSVRDVEGLGVKAGTIPSVVVEDYMRKAGITFNEFLSDDVHVRRILLDPDFKGLRVWEGKF